MIWILVLIGLILAIVGYKLYDSFSNYDFTFELIGWFGGILCGIAGLIGIMLLCIYPYNVDKKLTMYQEENALIEEKVKNTVIGYMGYEKEFYNDLVKNSELESLLLRFPELNSNELVKSEIELYTMNNKQIKNLKEQLIDQKLIGWWLFFNI